MGKDLVMQNILSNKNKQLDKIKQLFNKMDSDTSGGISLEELEWCLQDRTVQAYFEYLELDVSDAWTFFKLLDTDGGNSVGLDEFLLGCMRLRGYAKAIDMAALIKETEWLNK